MNATEATTEILKAMIAHGPTARDHQEGGAELRAKQFKRTHKAVLEAQSEAGSTARRAI